MEQEKIRKRQEKRRLNKLDILFRVASEEVYYPQKLVVVGFFLLSFSYFMLLSITGTIYCMTRRKRYNNERTWEREPKEITIKMSEIRLKTYAEILDVWKEFWNQGLIDEAERKMLKTILKQELCSCQQDRPTEEEELQRINKLANSLKGTLDKAVK